MELDVLCINSLSAEVFNHEKNNYPWAKQCDKYKSDLTLGEIEISRRS